MPTLENSTTIRSSEYKENFTNFKISDSQVNNEKFKIPDTNTPTLGSNRIFVRMEELEETIAENIVRVEGATQCKICGKMSYKISNTKDHIETHFDGVVFNCDICSKPYRTRQSVRDHKKKSHKKV